MEHVSDLEFEAGGHHPGGSHPSVIFYTIIAIVLFVVTALEVCILYPPLSETGTYFRVLVLVLLSLGKFILVVAFFMHLFFEAPLLTFLFAMGMVLGVGTVATLINVMPMAEHPLKPKGKVMGPEEISTPAPHALIEWKNRLPS